jgi:general secretion pathway protein I
MNSPRFPQSVLQTLLASKGDTGEPSQSPVPPGRRCIRRIRATPRAGMTLLEIIIALTIFFGAMTALSQLAWNGSRAAVQARLKTQAIIRCEAKLAEVLCGVEPLQPKTRVPFSDNEKWSYSVTVSESQYPDLLQIHVTVFHTGNTSLANVEFSLSRWMRDPSLYLDAAELQKTEAEKEAQTQGVAP